MHVRPAQQELVILSFELWYKRNIFSLIMVKLWDRALSPISILQKYNYTDYVTKGGNVGCMGRYWLPSRFRSINNMDESVLTSSAFQVNQIIFSIAKKISNIKHVFTYKQSSNKKLKISILPFIFSPSLYQFFGSVCNEVINVREVPNNK